MSTKKYDSQSTSLVKAFLFATIGSLICVFEASAVGAFLMVRGNFSGSAAAPIALAALCLGSFLAAWIGAKVLHHGALLCAGISFLLYTLIPGIIGAVGGQLTLSAELGMRIVSLLLCSLLGGILGTQTKRKKVH